MAIEVNFADRVPTYPGRVTLTPVEGQANTYDMVRADSPVVAGTPMSKATFDSVVQSRLTGRYYAPTVTKNIASSVSSTVNPIPSGGWLGTTKTHAAQNGYEIFSTDASAQSDLISSAFDRNSNTFWLGVANTATNYIGVKLPNAMRVTKMTGHFSYTDGDTHLTVVEVSNDGTTWTAATGSFYTGNGVTTVSISLPDPYMYYRFKITASGSIGIRCYEIAITEYTFTTYYNAFVVSTGMPLVWNDYQRVSIVTPANMNNAGIVGNVFQGRNVNIILEPNTYYELIAFGDGFWGNKI